MKQAILDFESEAIDSRPEYPPKPVGLAFKLPGEPHYYAAWGHASENGVWALRGKKLCWQQGLDPQAVAKRALKEAAKCDSILGHNIAKFDADLSETHMGVRLPPEKIDDSLFTRFLVDPHAPTLSLKPSTEALLGEAPEERDVVYDWLYQHGFISKPKLVDGRLKYQKDAGAYISKAPGSLVAAYAIGDLTRSKGLFDLDMKIVKDLGMLEAYERERQVAPILLANERQGMRLDLERLERDLPEAQAAMEKCDAWLRKRLGVKTINFDSDEEVANALAKSGVVKTFPMTEPSSRFPNGQRSVSKANLTKRFFTDPDVYLALVYRNTVGYVITQNMLPWRETATRSGGFIYTIWNQVRSDADKGGARSGRITCSKWQNIIKNPTSGMNPDYRPEDDARIRKKIGLPPIPLSRRYCLPDPGELYVHRDWNQQELRLLAHYEEGKLAEEYRRDPATDIHSKVQQWMKQIGGREYDREPVKRADFLTAYGGGAPALSKKTHMTLDEAKAFLQVWRKAMPDVVILNKKLMGMYDRGESIRTFGGRVYRCKPSTVAKKGDKKGQMINFAYTALNYLLQPSGADLIKMALIGYHNHPKRRGRMLNIVHDELNASAPAKLATKENQILKEVMEGIKLDVPWKSDGDERPNWGEKAVA